MPVSKSVQIHNAAAVMAMFENRTVPRFAIFQDKQFMFKNEDEDMAEAKDKLTLFLQALADSPAVYTLKVYEDPKDGKIKSGTEDDGSFNFRLGQPLNPFSVPAVGNAEPRVSKLDAMLLELQELRQEIALIKEQDPEPAGGSLGVVGEILEMEAVKQLIPSLVPVIIGLITGKKPDLQPAAIAGVPGENVDADRKISQAIAILKKADPDLADHLHRLATLAQTDAAKFNQIIAAISFL